MEEDHFEIRVSHHLVRLFATHPESLKTEEQAIQVMNLLEEKFPAYEGYQVLLAFIEVREKGVVRRHDDGSIRVIND